MINLVWYLMLVLTALLFSLALFFFVLTRGALVLRRLWGQQGASAHVYPLYSNMWLIRLIDYQPLISGILLFQYPRLVSRIAQGLRQTDLRGKVVTVTSCAFGNVVPRVVQAAVEANAQQIVIADLLRNELIQAQTKLTDFSEHVVYLEENATQMPLADGSVDANILFFLLHELPHPMKALVLTEAARVLAPGGTLYIAEFHRPRIWPLRVSGWLYFKVFEPFGLALWDSEDPLEFLRAQGHWTFRRSTYLFGNYQVLLATKAL
jgi:SAM-dependent methyltransferase